MNVMISDLDTNVKDGYECNVNSCFKCFSRLKKLQKMTQKLLSKTCKN